MGVKKGTRMFKMGGEGWGVGDIRTLKGMGMMV